MAASAITLHPGRIYPGLRPFDVEDALLFFGREEQTDELLRRLDDTRFLAVVGLSGSGKSSLVRAGLLPALRRGHLTGAGSRWQVPVMRPGSDPLGALARVVNETFGERSDRLATLRSGKLGLLDTSRQGRNADENMLLVVDQFEEIFRFQDSYRRRAGEAAEFVQVLLAACQEYEPAYRLYVVITLRSDYLGECARFAGLPEALNESQYLVPRMTRERLREAIEGPAALGGVVLSEELREELLDRTDDDPDQLPVLQHLLMRMWEIREPVGAGFSMGHDQYNAVGGWDDALNTHAAKIFNALGDRRDLAKRIFQRLTEKAEAGREVRRPATVHELEEVGEVTAGEVKQVAEHFRGPGCNLLTSPDRELTEDSVIDISHESLIRRWKQLNEWTTEEAGWAEWYRRVEDRVGIGAACLVDPELESALQARNKGRWNEAWAERYRTEKDGVRVAFGDVIRFLEESRKRRTDELDRLRRRLWVTIGLISSALIIVSVFWYAYKRHETAKEQRVLNLFLTASEMQRNAEVAGEKYQGASNAFFGPGSHTDEESKNVIALGLNAKASADKAHAAFTEAQKNADDAGFQSIRTDGVFKQISGLQKRLVQTQEKLDNALATQRTAEREPPSHTTLPTTVSAHTPIDWNAAIRYARLVNDAYATTNEDLMDRRGSVISDAPEYTVLHSIYGNDLSTDMNPSRGNALINYGFLALSQSGELVVAIRSSEGVLEWLHDAQFLMVPTPFAASGGSTEAGFTSVYGSLRTGLDPASTSLKAAIDAQIDSGSARKITVCGHSVGGALATLIAFDVALNSRNKAPVFVYTYASPRVGNRIFAQRYNQAVPKTFRIANRLDLVTKLPLPPRYQHVGELFELSPFTGTRMTVKPELSCSHILSTYIWLIDETARSPSIHPLSPECTP
jgi:hypothetical protein